MVARVTIAGNATEIPVEVGPDGLTVDEVLKRAAEGLGRQGVDLSRLAPVVNGADVGGKSVVFDGDVVTAAPTVQNG